MNDLHVIHPSGKPKPAPNRFVEHGAYVQDVLYAGCAGVTTGDAASVKIHTCSEVS